MLWSTYYQIIADVFIHSHINWQLLWLVWSSLYLHFLLRWNQDTVMKRASMADGMCSTTSCTTPVSKTSTRFRKLRVPLRHSAAGETRRKSLLVRLNSMAGQTESPHLNSSTSDMRQTPMHSTATKACESERLAAGCTRQSSMGRRIPCKESATARSEMERSERSVRKSASTESKLQVSTGASAQNQRRRIGAAVDEEAEQRPSAKRVVRQPQRYESDTFSTFSRKRDVITRRRADPVAEPLPTIPENSTRCSSSSRPNDAVDTQPPGHKVQKDENKLSKSQRKTQACSNTSEHGAKCWDVCDCVLVEILRSQPFVELCERNGKKIQFIINSEEATTMSSNREKGTRRKGRKVRNSCDSNTAEC